ncbi:MAG: HemK2/MTQ2 family protein methyltransferase [Thermoplasmata archaeon]
MKIERCPGVYDPDDDSYMLTGINEVAGNILEIGCGTGIVGLSYAATGGRVLMADISPKAARCAKANALRNGIEAEVVISDLFSGIRGKFDYCIFNPPYLPSGDADDTSWTGGPKGNEITAMFLGQFKNYCKVAFIIESSISPIERGSFPSLSFKVMRSMQYESERIDVVRVE